MYLKGPEGAYSRQGAYSGQGAYLSFWETTKWLKHNFGTYLEADNKLVGHVPMELSFLIFTFLKARHENKYKSKWLDQEDWKTERS